MTRLAFALALASIGCGIDKPDSPPSAPLTCQDVVIWNSPAQDCAASGGVPQVVPWPQATSEAVLTCNFCESAR